MKVLLVLPEDGVCGTLRTVVEELADVAVVIEARGMTAMTSQMVAHPELDLLVAHLHAARAFQLLRSAEHAAIRTTRLVVWSAAASKQELVSAAALGAMAYVPTAAPCSVTRAALQMVMAGGRYFPPDLLVGTQLGDWQAHASVRPTLTPRQAEVLRLMSAGRSNKAIAQELGTTAGTVKVHVTAILKALDVRNRTEAVMLAQRGRNSRRFDDDARQVIFEP